MCCVFLYFDVQSLKVSYLFILDYSSLSADVYIMKRNQQKGPKHINKLSDMPFRELKVGKVIYRARRVNDKTGYLVPNKCEDTDKTGLYFSDLKKLCLGMMFEYRLKSVDLCKYTVVKPVALYVGKYSFRNIHPKRYFNGSKFIPNVDTLTSENISHYDKTAIPIYKDADKHFSKIPSSAYGEIFISSKDMHHLSYVSKHTYTREEAKEMMES